MLLAAPFPVHDAEEIPAVNMKVHLEGGHLELDLTATTVKFPQLQPDDLDSKFQVRLFSPERAHRLHRTEPQRPS